MWIFMNDAFLSVVQHFDKPDMLMVRARFAPDIGRVFPGAEVRHTPENDYAYRAEISKTEVAQVMTDRIENIEYTNFKDSVWERDRHDHYFNVWYQMLIAQNQGR